MCRKGALLPALLASKGFAKLHGWRREENRVGGIQSKDSHFSKIFIHNTAKEFNDTGFIEGKRYVKDMYK